jgi:hypothetical protein
MECPSATPPSDRRARVSPGSKRRPISVPLPVAGAALFLCYPGSTCHSEMLRLRESASRHSGADAGRLRDKIRSFRPKPVRAPTEAVFKFATRE